MTRKLKIICVVILTVTFVFSSCTLHRISLRKQAENSAGLSRDSALVVGRVVYEPPFSENTQQVPEYYKYRLYLLCGYILRHLNHYSMMPGSADFEGAIETFEGETFYAESPPSPFYIITSAFYKVFTVSNDAFNRSTFNLKSVTNPASFRVEILPGDRAVYVGTIKYHRDNFFNIKRIEIIDDYDREMPEFRRRFGNIYLRKALIRQPPRGFEYGVGDPY